MATIDSDSTGAIERKELIVSPDQRESVPNVVSVILDALRRVAHIGMYGADELWNAMDSSEKQQVLDNEKTPSEKSKYFIAAANRLRHST